MTLYVAYGSNLCKSQMRQRCPTARSLGKFIFRECRLVFRSVADLEYDKTAETPCGLYNISRDDERALDGYEGVASGIYFKSEQTIMYEGGKVKALVYLMNSNGIYPPSKHYAEIIRRGYKDFGMDTKCLDEAIAHAYNNKSPDHGIARRRKRQIEGDLHRKLAENPNRETEPPLGLFSDGTPTS